MIEYSIKSAFSKTMNPCSFLKLDSRDHAEVKESLFKIPRGKWNGISWIVWTCHLVTFFPFFF